MDAAQRVVIARRSKVSFQDLVTHVLIQSEPHIGSSIGESASESCQRARSKHADQHVSMQEGGADKYVGMNLIRVFVPTMDW